ncbi:zinc finger CCCH domain-containing protein 55-like [Ipomoea triloba]|uniref:zinc finger CCCH domain-containing protein 55-like n=1 Tax=Ipomoea triloba TaxID=35885 RepID=UPI00125D3974|nr:zinc finger CCCH domain-containing protein 55-like [Ipomoea triloba]XP_031115606.1 zinc finger CCCH domain-containing protein 55-like [Ipomoea triloba]XP_031115607.1 zinc finger CCCH domain-containing protein 55-like [Ipomoea triloba]
MLVNKGVMGESVRKRRSMWDTEENFSRHELNAKNAWVGKCDYPSHDGRSYQEQVSSKTDNSSKRHSGWNHSPQNSLLQTSQRISKDVERLPETEEHKREKFYHENMSPTFDGRRQLRNSQFPEHGLSQSRRHPGRGRSRSPGRAKGRSRSRSWSRDRRWRSRSRSRSRDKGNLRGRSRSSSPNYKGDPYGWDDRQIGSRISSKVCRDFANGKCRRGGECRFFHPDNFKNRDGYSSEYNLAERWGSRNENGDASRYADTEALEVHFRGKIPDAYNIEHEHPRNNRGMITCKDFVKGKCRWGASCRFSHSGTSGHNYDSSIRNASSDYDREHEPSKTSKTLCKYFVAGKCYSENCKFSHDGPTPSNVEMRPSDDIGGHRLDEKNDSWVCPKWNDAEMDSSFVRASRRGDNVGKSDNSGAVDTDRNNHIGDHSVADTNKLWNKPVWDDAARASNLEKNSEWDDTALRTNPTVTVSVDQINSRWTYSLENERAIWQNTASCEERDATPNVIAAKTSESILEILTNNQENNILSQASQSRNLNGSSVHGERQDTMKETSGIFLSTKVMQPCLSSNRYIGSYPFEDSGKTIISNVSNDLNNSRQSIHPVSLPEQSFNETSAMASRGSEYSSFLGGAAQDEARLHAIPSNGHGIRSNEIRQSCQKEAATRPEVLELSALQNLSGAIFSVQTSQLHGSLASLTKKFEHEPAKSQLHAVLPSVVPSDSNSELLPTYNAVYTQPNPMINAPDLCHAHSDGFKWGTPGNYVMPAANASYLDKQETSVSLKQSNELPALNSENRNIDKFDDSNVEYTKDLCLKLQEAVAKSEVKRNNRLVAKECDDGQENKNSHKANGRGKDEEVNANKDDKVIRLFKNALIEFVKEILKPTWKEGRMSREVHKTVVKKVVDKVTGSIQGDHFPKTQDKIEQFLSYSKAKINKLAQAYVERCLKANT